KSCSKPDGVLRGRKERREFSVSTRVPCAHVCSSWAFERKFEPQVRFKKSKDKTSEAKPAIAVVDNDESVCSAMNQFIHWLGMDTDTFTNGTGRRQAKESGRVSGGAGWYGEYHLRAG